MSSDTLGGTWSYIVVPKMPFTTVILFSVRVPVLSLSRIVVLPRVSHAARWRTNRLSFIIFFIEYVRTIITAAGSPSGIPITRMVIENTTKRRGPSENEARGDSVPQRTIWAMNTATLTKIAMIAQYLTNRSSFFWRGVFSDSFWMSAIVRPNSEFSPTATTNILAFPSVMTEPERNHGSASVLRMMMLSPVSADSSIPRALADTK